MNVVNVPYLSTQEKTADISYVFEWKLKFHKKLYRITSS